MIQYFEIPSVDVSLRKSILDGIVKRLLEESGASKADVVFIGDDDDTQAQTGSRIDGNQEQVYGAANKYYVEFTETRHEDNRIAHAIGLDYEVPVFDDRAHRVRIQPSLTRYDVELTITRSDTSKDRLQRWINRLNQLIDMGRVSAVYETESFYYLPIPALEFLHDVWKTINTYEVAYETFNRYLDSHLNPACFVTAGVTGEQKRLACRFAATRIEVVYETTPPTREKDELRHKASVNVTFEYYRPDVIQAHHPSVIRQNRLPAKWLPMRDPSYASNDDGAVKSDIQVLRDKLSDWGNDVILPVWDAESDSIDQVLPNIPPWHFPIWGSDVGFEPPYKRPQWIMDWEDFPFEWDEDVDDYINDCLHKDHHFGNCVINVTIYINGYPAPSKDIIWKDGDIYYNGDVVIENNYYIVVSIIIDWSRLPDGTFDNIRDHPETLDKIIDWLRPDITRPTPLPSGKIPWEDVDDLINDMTAEKHQTCRENWGPIYVHDNTIVVRRKE